MAVSVQCPQCNALYSISEAFPGSRVNCTQCGTILILDLQVEEPSRIPIVPPTSGPRHIDEKSPQFMKAAFQHLASWLDVSTSELEQAFNLVQSDQAYDLWKIPKGDGYSFREISAPKEVLKNVQRRILDRLLYRIPISNAAHGFIQGRSIVTNASYHLKNAQSIFNLDLKGAFPSVKAARVKHLLVRYLKIPLKHLGEQVQHSVLDKVIEILVKLTTYNDGLPQGSPASGYLLNVACITLDKNLLRLLQQHSSSYRYTRYADDMTISAPGELPEELREKIQKVVMNCGFEINPQKNSLCRSYQRTDAGSHRVDSGKRQDSHTRFANGRIPRKHSPGLSAGSRAIDAGKESGNSERSGFCEDGIRPDAKPALDALQSLYGKAQIALSQSHRKT